MTDDEIADWTRSGEDVYAVQRIRAGQPEQAARARAETDFGRRLPAGRPVTGRTS